VVARRLQFHPRVKANLAFLALSLTTACTEAPVDQVTDSLAATPTISLVARPAFDQWIAASAVCAPPSQSTPIDLTCPVKIQGTEPGTISVRKGPEIPRQPGQPKTEAFECVITCQIKGGDVELDDPGVPNNPATSVPFNTCTQLGTYAGVMQEIRDALKNLKLVGVVHQPTGVLVRVPIAKPYDPKAAREQAIALCRNDKAVNPGVCTDSLVVPAVIPTIGCFVPGGGGGGGGGGGSGSGSGTGTGSDAGTGADAAGEAGTGSDGSGSGAGSAGGSGL